MRGGDRSREEIRGVKKKDEGGMRRGVKGLKEKRERRFKEEKMEERRGGSKGGGDLHAGRLRGKAGGESSSGGGKVPD